MTELLDIPETVEAPQLKDVAVDFSEYFAVYMVGRGEYDRPADRISELNRISELYPVFADRIMLLDEQLEGAIDAEKGMILRRLPSANLTPVEIPDKPKGKAIQDNSAISPQDYTFSSVRHPIARRLLNLVNIAMLPDRVLEDPKLRSERLKENGQKMVKNLVGDVDQEKLMRVRSIDVLGSIFSGELVVNSPQRVPEFERNLES